MTTSGSFIVGIDLGTTHCTLSYHSLEEKGASGSPEEITTLAIPQRLTAALEGASETLPSVAYFPLEEEREQLGGEASYVLGGYARERGEEVPHRCVSSAKSWLCHSGVDRRSKLLPSQEHAWMSPVEACTALLQYLRDVWNVTQPSHLLSDQQVLITVPASFDPSARQLVQEAAEGAGLGHAVLLEEPQAAFYAWLHKHPDEWRSLLKAGDSVLVIDIGGGTTDFSLIDVHDENGALALERRAVGAHLLLGGDNLDLALAYLCRHKLEEQGHDIDEWQMVALTHQCRKAKEEFLSEQAPTTKELTIQGRGTRLIGGSLSATLNREEALHVLIEGFCPFVGPSQQASSEQRLGIQQMGLPYAQDPRISSQLAHFLALKGETQETSLDNFVLPTKVLFNGGTVKASALRQRLMELLKNWAEELQQSVPEELPHPEFDLAVSRGAVYYGLVRNGTGIRIRSGTSRTFFIGVEQALPAVPGVPAPLEAVCVAPFGMEEGSEQTLTERKFALTLGQKATFRFFSRTAPTLADGTEVSLGSTVKRWRQELTELHPIEAILDAGTEGSRHLPVTLQAKVTELGVLELWCVSDEGERWKLEFDLRNG